MEYLNAVFCFIMQLCICVIGYIGNSITCIVIASSKSMHTTTNVYLFNLAIADFMMLTTGLLDFTIPYWYLTKGQHKELEGCAIRKSILNTTFNVSIMTITAFTIERYLAVCHPFLARRILSISKAIKLIFIFWIIGAILGYLVGSQYTLLHSQMNSKNIVDCSSDSDVIAYVVNTQFFIFFILPFLLLSVLYILMWKKLAESSKIQKNQGSNKNIENSSGNESGDGSNKRVYKMLAIVVAAFFISWAPYHIGRIYRFNFQVELLIYEIFYTKNYYINSISNAINRISSTAYFISASANPIIYSAMSNRFRDAFKEVVIKRWFGHPKQVRKVKDKQISIETAV